MPGALHALDLWSMGATVLAAALSCAALVVAASRWRPLRDWLVARVDFPPMLPSLVGTLFALMASFLANAVWTNDDRAHDAVAAEARAITAAGAFLRALPGDEAGVALRLLSEYVAEAAEAEWPAMAGGGESGRARALLLEIKVAALRIASTSPREIATHREAVEALDQVAEARARRLQVARLRISPMKWFGVVSLGAMTLLGIAVVSVRDWRSQALATSLFAIAAALALFVVLAHDQPFVGPNAADPGPLRDALATVRR